jgi:hypothetical protein
VSGCAVDEGFVKILELLKTFFEDGIEKKGMFPSRRKTHSNPERYGRQPFFLKQRYGY